MTPDRFRACLDALHWSQRGLADMLGLQPTTVRRWVTGHGIIPANVGTRLEHLTAPHQATPLPEGWRAAAPSTRGSHQPHVATAFGTAVP